MSTNSKRTNFGHIEIIACDAHSALFHWLLILTAGNNGEYFAAAWPGKILQDYSLRGRKVLKIVQKISKNATLYRFLNFEKFWER